MYVLEEYLVILAMLTIFSFLTKAKNTIGQWVSFHLKYYVYLYVCVIFIYNIYFNYICM